MPEAVRSPDARARRRRARQLARGTARLLVAAWLAAGACRGARGGTGPALDGAYTPLQLRQAYREPPLPAHWNRLDAARAASFGAGQTVYVLALYGTPGLAEDVNEFSRSFGLPTCSVLRIPTDAIVPLAAAPAGSGCTLSVLHATASGTLSSRAPAYDPNWAREAAADLEWAHASAPLARLIEVDSAPADWAAALGLINTLGPGVVSMSMIAPEGVAMHARLFDNADMSYLAGTGDAGRQVNWPSVLPRVLAVGGSVLRSYTADSREETVWASAGGGISRYVAAPTYQSGVGRGMRSVPDVVMNAGAAQVLVRIPRAASSPSGRDLCPAAPRAAISAPATAAPAPAGPCPPAWSAVVGTSVATPEWAGILAVANAERALSGHAALGEVQPLLYALLSRPGLYARVFQDIRSGSNGGCPSCGAGAGFDTPSGLGSPNVGALLAYLRSCPAPVAPIVGSLRVRGRASRRLDFDVPLSAVEPVRWSLTGAPRGMRIGAATGVVRWPWPTQGSYLVTATATDPRTRLSASAMLRVRIASSDAARSMN